MLTAYFAVRSGGGGALPVFEDKRKRHREARKFKNIPESALIKVPFAASISVLFKKLTSEFSQRT